MKIARLLAFAALLCGSVANIEGAIGCPFCSAPPAATDFTYTPPSLPPRDIASTPCLPSAVYPPSLCLLITDDLCYVVVMLLPPLLPLLTVIDIT